MWFDPTRRTPRRVDPFDRINEPSGSGLDPESVDERVPILDERADRRVGTTAGGQQQMLAMGATLVLDPDLLILDEPSAGLAPQIIDDVFERILAINDRGTTVLMVEQNARRALRESDRGVVLDMGTDRFEGTGEELLDSEAVAELYLGGADRLGG